VEKYCRARRTHLNIVRRMCTARWIRLQTYTHNTQYLQFFHCNDGCTTAPHCYVIRILSVLLNSYNQKCVTKTPILLCYRKQQASCHETLCQLTNPNNGKFKPPTIRNISHLCQSVKWEQHERQQKAAGAHRHVHFWIAKNKKRKYPLHGLNKYFVWDFRLLQRWS